MKKSARQVTPTGLLIVIVIILSLFVVINTISVFAKASAKGNQEMISELSQFGITWTFDREYEYGQFANGDYWVVGPMTITAIFPLSTDNAGRTMHGAMINPSPNLGSTQGYDSAMYGTYGPAYDPLLNVALDVSPANPLHLPTDTSLVSTISLPAAGERPQLHTAAILTILPTAPPPGSFRPAYSGPDKSIQFNIDDIDVSQLANLPPVANTPPMTTVADYFERPWLDHVPNWLGRYTHPQANMPDYGRDLSSHIGVGALMLQLDYPLAEKETLLIRFIQLGIDLYGVANNGGEHNWAANGGHASGRKWPILFAGIMLDAPALKQIGPGDGSGTILFGEDAQTFYVSQADIDRDHDPDLRGCYLSEYMSADLGLPEWGIRHNSEPNRDNKAWCAVYRQCCTANAWVGIVLAAHLMDAESLWAHQPLFDYQDRYMAEQEPQTWTRSWDSFSETMWDTYRYYFVPTDEMYLPLINH